MCAELAGGAEEDQNSVPVNRLVAAAAHTLDQRVGVGNIDHLALVEFGGRLSGRRISRGVAGFASPELLGAPRAGVWVAAGCVAGVCGSSANVQEHRLVVSIKIPAVIFIVEAPHGAWSVCHRPHGTLKPCSASGTLAPGEVHRTAAGTRTFLPYFELSAYGAPIAFAVAPI